MPNLPISSLPELTAITSNAEFVIEQSGTTYKIKNSVLTSITSGRGISANTSTGNVTISHFQNNIIIVGQSGTVDFNSIKNAVDSITSSSQSNRYVIQVGPGVYEEKPIDLSSKPYVSIVGSDILEVLIVPPSGYENGTMFTLGNANELSFMTISKMTSGFGIKCTNTGGFSLVHKISMYDNDTHISVYADTLDTEFFGEYIDFNGDYSYGISVIADGAICSANLENHYNYVTGGLPTIAYLVQGSQSSLNVTTGDNQGNGTTDSICFLVQDRANLNISSINLIRWDYGLYFPNVGGFCTFDIDGISIIDSGSNDLRVDQQFTKGSIQGSLSHQMISNIAPDVYWAFLDHIDGELDITRKLSITFEDGTHTDTSTLIFQGGTMGLISGGTITSIGGLSAQTSTGFGYLQNTGTEIFQRIDWVDSVILLSPNTNNYLYINSSSILSASNTLPDNTENIILGRVVTNVSTIEFIDDSPQLASHTSNLFSTFNRTALGPVYATGSLVTQNPAPFKINVSNGNYFFSENEFSPSGGSGLTFTQYYRNGIGGWNTSATTVVQGTSFDNNGTLSGLTASAFTKHTLYVVGDGSNEKYFLVVGQSQYNSLVLAESADLPTPPTYFNDGVTPISSIYIQQGASNIIQFEDIRPVIGFKAGGVNASSLHANLLGLAADDHQQYLLVNGGRSMSGSLNMSGNTITNSGTINGVTIETHASRHKSGGSDPVGTATPTASAIPYADVNGKLDSWITPITISGGSNIITGGTYPNFTVSLSSSLTGLTDIRSTAISATTISASTYYNVPSFVNMVFAHSSVGPADATTYYIGALSNLSPSTANRDAWAVNSQYTGSITEVSIISNFGGGSSENSTMTIYNLSAGTSQVITSSLQYVSGTPVQVLSETFSASTIPAGWSSFAVVFNGPAASYAGLTGTTSTLTSPVFDGTAYASLNITSDVAKFGAGTDGPVLISYSLDNGGTYTSAGTTATPTSTTYLSSTVSIPATSSQMIIRFSVNPTGTSGKRFRNLVINGLSSSINTNYTLGTPLSVTSGDKLQIRWLTPTWVTNPSGVTNLFNLKLRL